MKKYSLDNDYRIFYYCQNTNTKKHYRKNDAETYLTVENKSWYLQSKDNGKQEYIQDILYFIYKNQLEKEYPKIQVKLHPSDRVELFENIPTLVKTRIVTKDPKFSILLNLNIRRHFSLIKDVIRDDVPFEEKKNVLLWRGSTTGYGFGNHIPYRPTSRENLVERYFMHPNKNIDVGYSKLIQEALKRKSYYQQFLKSPKSISKMLQYKYILSVEGNDVASNLKWLLYSNSVVFMPKPYIESWIMETHLLPYVHYIPVANDFSDLQIKLQWCNEHQEQCRTIVKNAREYIEIFLDEKNEMEVVKKLLTKYINNVVLE